MLSYHSVSRVQSGEKGERRRNVGEYFLHLEACSNLEQNKNAVQFVLKKKKKNVATLSSARLALTKQLLDLPPDYTDFTQGEVHHSVWVMNIFGPFTPRLLRVCVPGWMCFIGFGLVIQTNISFYLVRNTEPLFCPWGWNKMFYYSQSFIFRHFSFLMHKFTSAG